MDVSQAYEVGRLRFRCERTSQASELLRWCCEQRKIAYIEQPRLAPDATEVLPRLVTPGGVATGLEDVLSLLDERCRDGERILGETDDIRAMNFDLLRSLSSTLATPALQLWYYHALEHPSLLKWKVNSEGTWWQRLWVQLSPALLKQRLRRRYRLEGFDPKAAESQIASALTQIEHDLSVRGTPFWCGTTPGPSDMVFAACLCPLVCPPNCGIQYPDLSSWPEPLRQLVEQIRARPAGSLALQIYQQARPPSQSKLPAPAYGPSLFERLLRPAVARWLAQSILRLFPRLAIGNRLIVSSWHDVTTVLSQDNEFLIAPINAARINSVGGPFMLGMDRSPALMIQREHVYAALRDSNKQPMLDALQRESSRLLHDALKRGGRIDVINGYARLVAGRTAAAVFGIRGPTEQDFLRVIRSIFHETFLNLSADKIVRERGIAAGKEIRSWIEAEIQRRTTINDLGDDVLGRLLQSCDSDFVAARLMLGGCLVGAIDTTATAVANIIAEVIADRNLKRQMQRDVDNSNRLLGWCLEALRRRPHNLGMLRQAGPCATLPGLPVKEGTQILLLTVAAMHDPAAFENPNKMIPDRPRDRYLHFGYGLHQCAGRNFNVWQIPFLVGELLRHDVSGKPSVRTRGPFPDELIVSIQP